MKGRRLFLILAISIAAFPSPPLSSFHSLEGGVHDYSPDADDGSSRTMLGGHVLWLQDEASGLCLGASGFSECGDTNLLRVRSSAYSETLELELVIMHLSTIDSESPSCLGRHRFRRELALQPCSRGVLSETPWTYGLVEGRLSSRTSCLQRNGRDATLGSCSSPLLATLRPVLLSQRTAPDPSAPRAAAVSSPASEWTCPHSGLVLPRVIGGSSGSLAPQYFAGGGVYTKQAFGFLFKVFSLALYVGESARRDDSLIAFAHYSPEELFTSSDFYGALMSPRALFDRSILVKMAMSVKRDLLVAGLVEDLGLRPESSALIAAAGRMFRSETCDRGLELLFTWRSAASGSESFDIRVAGRLVTSITAAGVGEDFFSRFVSREPVSLALKRDLATMPTTLSLGLETREDEPEAASAIVVEQLPQQADCRSVLSLMSLERCARRALQRPALVEEAYVSLLVLLYCCLLITQSLPSRAKLFRVVRLEQLRRIKSSLQLSAEHIAKKMSIHNSLHLLAAES
jgi:hypothetical protein